jgi:peroxiredoxin
MPSVVKPTVLRWVTAILVAAAVFVGYWWFRSPPSTRFKVGDRVPELELLTLEGRAPTRLSQFRGRVVLLTMFASACPLCDKELPVVERLHREFTKRDVVVLGIGADPDPAQLLALVRRHVVTFFVLHDPNGATIRQVFGTTRLPEAYLIDNEGIVRAVFRGDLAGKRHELSEQIGRLLSP